MKKTIWTFLVVAVFVIGGVSIAKAQITPATYTVQTGDNLWTLAGIHLGDSLKWGQVLGANPFLNQPGRQFTKPDGTIVVLIKPGEMLNGLEELGVKAEPLPIEQLVPPVQAAPAEAAVGPIAPDWIQWLLIVVTTAIGLWIFSALLRHYRRGQEARIEEERREERERELRQNPVTSGPPIVAGGVTPNETGRLSRALETAAVYAYVRLNPNIDRQTVHVERISPIEEGMISGEGMVGYADRVRPRRIDPPQPGYQARFRFPDGREDFLMSLQGCMNPCYYGEGLSGFQFEPRQAVVPAPEPPAPAPQAVPHPAIAVARIRTAAEGERHSTLTIGDRVMTFEHGVHFTVDEATGHLTVSSTSFEMTVKPKRTQRRVANQPTRRTASGDTQ